MEKDVIFGTYIPPYANFKPKPLKWYQKVWYTLYNARGYIFFGLLILLYISIIILCVKHGQAKFVPVSIASGLIYGLLIGFLQK